MTQSTQDRITALVSLLPLLEAHLDRHGSIVSCAQWVSPPDPLPPGWVPPPPEPDCMIPCWLCCDFETSRCTLREERWASEWLTLRAAYPELIQLEGREPEPGQERERGLLEELTYEHADWASALYWVYVQPWDDWNRQRRNKWAGQGLEWLSERFVGWIPTYVPAGMPRPDPIGEKKRRIVALWYQRELSHHAIAQIVGCHKSYVGKVLAALKGR